MMLATLLLGRTTSLKESFPWNRSQVFIFCSWALVYFSGLARSRDSRKEVNLVGQLTQKVQINTPGLCPRLQPVSLLPRPIYWFGNEALLRSALSLSNFAISTRLTPSKDHLSFWEQPCLFIPISQSKIPACGYTDHSYMPQPLSPTPSFLSCNVYFYRTTMFYVWNINTQALIDDFPFLFLDLLSRWTLRLGVMPSKPTLKCFSFMLQRYIWSSR